METAIWIIAVCQVIRVFQKLIPFVMQTRETKLHTKLLSKLIKSQDEKIDDFFHKM